MHNFCDISIVLPNCNVLQFDSEKPQANKVRKLCSYMHQRSLYLLPPLFDQALSAAPQRSIAPKDSSRISGGSSLMDGDVSVSHSQESLPKAHTAVARTATLKAAVAASGTQIQARR